MSWLLFSLIVILMLIMFSCILISFYLIFSAMKHQQSLLSSFQSNLRDLTNLAVSKDPMMYTQLQHTPTTETLRELIQTTKSNYDPQLMDDASIAQRMADSYKAQGMDPNLAFNQEALEEFNFGV